MIFTAQVLQRINELSQLTGVPVAKIKAVFDPPVPEAPVASKAPAKAAKKKATKKKATKKK